MEKLKFITRVEDISRNELIYIYHHLKVGNHVQIVKTNGNPSKFDVYFKGFYLGYICLPNWLESLLVNINSLKASVNSISKTKFLPTQGLDIEISF